MTHSLSSGQVDRWASLHFGDPHYSLSPKRGWSEAVASIFACPDDWLLPPPRYFSLLVRLGYWGSLVVYCLYILVVASAVLIVGVSYLDLRFGWGGGPLVIALRDPHPQEWVKGKHGHRGTWRVF